MIRLFLSLGTVLLAGTTATADELRLFSGETLTGKITKQNGSRVFFRLENGSVRAYHKRQIESAKAAGGEPVALSIELSNKPLSAAQSELLQQAGSPEQVLANPQLMRLLDDCSVAAVDELKRLIADPKCRTRDTAIMMLGLVGSPEAVRELVRIATEDPDAKIRFAAANRLMDGHVVRTVKSEGLLDTVKRGFEDRKRNIRFCFAYVAGKLGDTDALPVLKQYLKDPDHHFRESAALLLAQLGDGAGVPVLRKMLRSKGPDSEKVAICKALGELKARAALPELKRLAKSKDAQLATAAAQAIRAIEAAK